MRIRTKPVRTILISFLFSATALSGAETFRVHQLHALPLEGTVSEAKATAGMNDALAIMLPEDLTYINGIELTVKIPEIVAAWRDTIAYSVYKDIRPAPSPDKIDYSGERLSVGTFPGKLSYTIYIPLGKDLNIKPSPYYSVIDAIPDTEGRSVFFRMQLAMKGVPEAFEEAVFDITAKPVLRDLGELELTVTGPDGTVSDGSGSALYIDGEAAEKTGGSLFLKTGEHHLSLVSASYRDEVRTFRIEQARTTTLAVQLRDIAPALRIVSPQTAQVFFDDEVLSAPGEEFTITPGDHTVRFVIGDYEVVKTVSAVNGRSYTVNLSIDATIAESE